MTQSVNHLEVLKSLSDATSQLVQKVSRSVVGINARMSRGTGIVLNNEGYIVTCNHVLHGCSTVKIGQGEKTYNAQIIGTDPYNDVALLKAEGSSFTPIELADSDNLETGQYAIALANPFNTSHPTATTGIITNPEASIPHWRGMSMENVIATDAKLNPGFSGGPLINVEGKLIGMNTAYVWSRGLAIPSNKLKSIVDGLLNGGQTKRAYLGIVSSTVEIPQELAEESGIDQERGVMIFSVERGSPAKQAGLAMGDVIVKFNCKPVTDLYNLLALLTAEVIGKQTKLTLLRGEQLTTLTIVPKEAETENDD